MSLNCQSINAKFNELQIIVEEICNNLLSVICLQESWLKESSDFSLYNLANYKLINQFRTECSDHGGLMTYIHDIFDVSPPIKILESVSGILINKISDHQPIFTCNNRVSPLCNESKYIQIETKDELSLGKFIDELQQADIIIHLSQDTS